MSLTSRSFDFAEFYSPEKMFDLIAQIPLVKFLINEANFSMYGSFMRFFAEYCFEHEHLPPFKKILQFLQLHDIDFENRGYESKIDEIVNAVRVLGGAVEYAGNEYGSFVKFSNDDESDDEGKFSRYRNGHFKIWIPMNVISKYNWRSVSIPDIISGKARVVVDYDEKTAAMASDNSSFIKIDLWIQGTSAHYTTEDFDVNCARFYRVVNEYGELLVPAKYWFRWPESECIANREFTIMPFVMNSSWGNLPRQFLRWKKMQTAGYRPSKENHSRMLMCLNTIVEMFNSTDGFKGFSDEMLAIRLEYQKAVIMDMQSQMNEIFVKSDHRPIARAIQAKIDHITKNKLETTCMIDDFEDAYHGKPEKSLELKILTAAVNYVERKRRVEESLKQIEEIKKLQQESTTSSEFNEVQISFYTDSEFNVPTRGIVGDDGDGGRIYGVKCDVIPITFSMLLDSYDEYLRTFSELG